MEKRRGELLHETIDRLKAAYDYDPAELENRVDHAVRSLVCLRDRLIAERRAPEADEPAQPANALQDVNAALSLLVGVDFPAEGIKRELMKKAEQILQSLDTHQFNIV